MIRCVLWDFGDTLADERWLLAAPDDLPNWTQAWLDVVKGGLAAPWALGKIGLRDVAGEVGRRLCIPVEDVVEHAQSRCTQVRFFERPLEVARRSSLPQAIVTVNPDIFSEYLVPYYKLDEIFDAIVTSWQEGTADKGELGLIALQRIAGQIRPRETLLIENKRKNVDAWRSKGGQAYLFSGEEQFDLDLRSTLAELAATAGMAAAVTPRSP